MKRYITVLLTILTLISCINKSNPIDITKVYPLKEYQDDFKQMVELLRTKHPQPYEFIPEDSLTNMAKIQYDKITDSTKISEFLWLCEAVVSAINCGHTDMLGPNYSKLPQSQFFPVNVYYFDSKLYVTNTRENTDKLSPGDEILSINGIKSETIQKEMFQHLSSDGDGTHKNRKYELTNFNFSWLCPLFFNYPDYYLLTVKRKENVEEIKLGRETEFKPNKSFLYTSDSPLCFDINEEKNAAIITIRSFDYYGKQISVFKSFIDDCFHQINENNIENLIIDLRHNGGGEPACSSYLLEHITKQPFTYFQDDVKGYSKLKKTIQPNPNGFKNKPYVLTDGMCFSSTGHFCSIIKEKGWAILVGDETGGTYSCNDFGKFYTLDNTDLKIRVATRTVKTTATTLSNLHGIAPDYYVMPNMNNILMNTDTVMNYTLKLIGNKL